MNRETFFAAIRGALFDGCLSHGQVDGITAVLDAWMGTYAAHCGQDLRQLAYALATVHHETKRFTDLEEDGRGRGKKYGIPDPETGQVYYGRGPSQTTWRRNYEVMGKRHGLDLLHHPELAATWDHGVPILFDGMIHGLFTGKRLSDYFGRTTCDWVQARRIINGLDKAALIAGYARSFYAALQEAHAR